jgi:hypothetical protein
VVLLWRKGRSYLDFTLALDDDKRESFFRLLPLLLTSSDDYETLPEVRNYRVLAVAFFRGHSAQLSRAGKLPKFYCYATIRHIGAMFCGRPESFAI